MILLGVGWSGEDSSKDFHALFQCSIYLRIVRTLGMIE